MGWVTSGTLKKLWEPEGTSGITYPFAGLQCSETFSFLRIVEGIKKGHSLGPALHAPQKQLLCLGVLLTQTCPETPKPLN